MPKLDGTVEKAGSGVHGFDASESISSAAAATFRSQGFAFCVRYLARGVPQGSSDLQFSEAKQILEAGLALMPVQHVERSGWTPTASKGAQYGHAAAQNADSIGFPAGVNVWLDLEGVKSGVAPETVIAYCNAWFAEVAAANYVPGIYVGSSCGLSGDDLFWRLRTTHYWRSGSKVPDIPQRGYQLIQKIIRNDEVAGVEIDRDLTVTDNFGDTVLWLAPSTARP
jgi:hypothetical protein